MTRVSFETMKNEIKRVLLSVGMEEKKLIFVHKFTQKAVQMEFIHMG